MSNKMLVYSSIGVVAGILILLLLNLFMGGSTSQIYLKPNDVKGMALNHNGKLYTLNFDQQNSVITYLNLSKTVNKEDYQDKKEEFPYSELVIYLFNKPDVVITPLSKRNTNIVYSAPAWNPNGYLLETSGGQLDKLLNNAYD